ncbi:hypothetical protein MKW92_053136 [Papaver armeniacum]|nr:hypothetical protein MKW92_053136 [Papaver armeniacum]
MSKKDLPTKETAVLKGHEGAVLAARFNSDGNYCLSCGKDRTIRLWNPDRGIPIKTYKAHGREVRDVHVTSDNSKLSSCGGDRQVYYWDVSTGRVIRKFRGHDSEVNAFKFDEYSTVVVSAGYDQSVRAWDCRSHFIALNQFRLNSFEIINCLIVHIGLCITLVCLQVIDTFTDIVMSICLKKTEIIAGSVDGSVRTFDICVGRTSGELVQEYTGHTCKSFKMDCCLTNTDAHVVGDASVTSSSRAHSSVVTSVGYHPKDNCMITASFDSTIRVWKT